jgi:hypothetical protein
VTCPPGTLCQPLQKQPNDVFVGVCQRIEGSTPQPTTRNTQTTSFPAASRQVIVNGIFKVDADFSIIKSTNTFKQQIAKEFTDKILHTESNIVNITQLKAGSILVYFDILSTTYLSTEYIINCLKNWTTSVVFLYEGVEYQTKLLSYSRDNATNSQENSDLLIIVLIPVLVPICLIIIVVVIIVSCKMYKADHELLRNSPTCSVLGVSHENLAKGFDNSHYVTFDKVKVNDQTTTISEA